MEKIKWFLSELAKGMILGFFYYTLIGKFFTT